jgi:hypothetical protein
MLARKSLDDGCEGRVGVQVACAGAISQFVYAVENRGGIDFLVSIALEVRSMTASAVSHDLTMVELHIEPTTRRMAVLARIRALNVIQRLPSGGHAIVTAETVPTDSRMIEARIRPCTRRMTVLAEIAALNMAH